MAYQEKIATEETARAAIAALWDVVSDQIPMVKRSPDEAFAARAAIARLDLSKLDVALLTYVLDAEASGDVCAAHAVIAAAVGSTQARVRSRLDLLWGAGLLRKFSAHGRSKPNAHLVDMQAVHDALEARA